MHNDNTHNARPPAVFQSRSTHNTRSRTWKKFSFRWERWGWVGLAVPWRWDKSEFRNQWFKAPSHLSRISDSVSPASCPLFPQLWEYVFSMDINAQAESSFPGIFHRSRQQIPTSTYSQPSKIPPAIKFLFSPWKNYFSLQFQKMLCQIFATLLIYELSPGACALNIRRKN